MENILIKYKLTISYFSLETINFMFLFWKKKKFIDSSQE